jgi:hypothetical protein
MVWSKNQPTDTCPADFFKEGKRYERGRQQPPLDALIKTSFIESQPLRLGLRFAQVLGKYYNSLAGEKISFFITLAILIEAPGGDERNTPFGLLSQSSSLLILSFRLPGSQCLDAFPCLPWVNLRLRESNILKALLVPWRAWGVPNYLAATLFGFSVLVQRRQRPLWAGLQYLKYFSILIHYCH